VVECEENPYLAQLTKLMVFVARTDSADVATDLLQKMTIVTLRCEWCHDFCADSEVLLEVHKLTVHPLQYTQIGTLRHLAQIQEGASDNSPSPVANSVTELG
jgi:hypothetical protein